MKRLIFEEEHEMFRDSVRSFFINEIQPHRERWREQGIVDREAFQRAGEQGLLMSELSRELEVSNAGSPGA